MRDGCKTILLADLQDPGKRTDTINAISTIDAESLERRTLDSIDKKNAGQFENLPFALNLLVYPPFLQRDTFPFVPDGSMLAAAADDRSRSSI